MVGGRGANEGRRGLERPHSGHGFPEAITVRTSRR